MSSEEDGKEFKNDLSDEENKGDEDVVSSGSECDSSGPMSIFSLLKPYHIPSGPATRQKPEEEKKANEQNSMGNDQSIDTNTQTREKGKPPVPPKPKRKSFHQDVSPSVDADENATSLPSDSQGPTQVIPSISPIEAELPTGKRHTDKCELGDREGEKHATLENQHDKLDTMKEQDDKNETIEDHHLDVMKQDNINHARKTNNDDLVTNTSCPPPSLQSYVVIDKKHDFEYSIPFADPVNDIRDIVCKTSEEQDLYAKERTTSPEGSAETDEYFDSIENLNNQPLLEQKHDIDTVSQAKDKGEENNDERIENQDHNNMIPATENSIETLQSHDSSFIVLSKDHDKELFISMSSNVASEDIGNISLSQYTTSNKNASGADKEDMDEMDGKIQKVESEQERSTKIQEDKRDLVHTLLPRTVEDVNVANQAAMADGQYSKSEDQEIIDEDKSKAEIINTKPIQDREATFESFNQQTNVRNSSQDEDCSKSVENDSKDLLHGDDAPPGKVEQEIIHDDQKTEIVETNSFKDKLAMFESMNEEANKRHSSQDGGCINIPPGDVIAVIPDDDSPQNEISYSQKTLDLTDNAKDNPRMSVKQIASKPEDTVMGYVTVMKPIEDTKTGSDQHADKIDAIPDITDENVLQNDDSVVDNNGPCDNTTSDIKDEDTTHETETKIEQPKVETISKQQIPSQVHSKSEPALDSQSSHADKSDATPPLPPRPPKSQNKEKEQQPSIPPFYQYQYYPSQFYGGNQPMQQYSYEGGQYMYPSCFQQYPSVQYPTTYATGQPQQYMSYTSGYFQNKPANAPAPDQHKQTKLERSKGEKSSQTHAKIKSDEKHADKQKEKTTVNQTRGPVKKGQVQKDLKPPPHVHKSSVPPSRPDRRIPKERSQRSNSTKKSQEKSTNSAHSEPAGIKASKY